MYKPAGVGPIEVWTEQIRANGNLYGVGVSDDYATTAFFNGSPARPTHVHDQVTFAISPIETDWAARRHGTLPPAKVAAGNPGTKRDGQAT
jgi:hypothetical protein